MYLCCSAEVDLLLCLQQLIWLQLTNHQNIKSRLKGVTKKKKNLLLAIFSLHLLFPLDLPSLQILLGKTRLILM